MRRATLYAVRASHVRHAARAGRTVKLADAAQLEAYARECADELSPAHWLTLGATRARMDAAWAEAARPEPDAPRRAAAANRAMALTTAYLEAWRTTGLYADDAYALAAEQHRLGQEARAAGLRERGRALWADCYPICAVAWGPDDPRVRAMNAALDAGERAAAVARCANRYGVDTAALCPQALARFPLPRDGSAEAKDALLSAQRKCVERQYAALTGGEQYALAMWQLAKCLEEFQYFVPKFNTVRAVFRPPVPAASRGRARLSCLAAARACARRKWGLF